MFIILFLRLERQRLCSSQSSFKLYAICMLGETHTSYPRGELGSQYSITEGVMEYFAHAQTVRTRPLSIMRPGNEASAIKHISLPIYMSKRGSD